MEWTVKAFFYATRRYGVSIVVKCLTETRLSTWDARYAYMDVKAEDRRLELYNMDLLWLLAKRHYDNLPQPSVVARGEKKDTRTAKQIEIDTLKKLGVWEMVKWKYSA